MKRIIFGIGRFLGATGRATVALIGIASLTAALANYTMTQGSGTTFGSIVVSTVHYVQQLVCDPTTPSQCGAVDTHGQQLIDVNTTNNNLYAAVTGPIPAGANIIGKVGIDQTTPGTTNGVQVNAAVPLGSGNGGLSVKTLAGLGVTPTSIKASAGQIYSVQCQNNDATHVAYIQLFNTTPVSLGSTAPLKFVGIPPTLNSGYAFSLVGEQFSSVIIAAAASTATGGSAPTTAIDCTVDFN